MSAVVSTRPLAMLGDVHFSYPRPRGEPRPVLRGVDLALPAGDLVALLGANGSGKTTLLRLLSGALVPDAGEVRFDGRPLGEWRRDALARRVAVLPQQLDLPDGFRAAELVAMGRAPHARRLFASTVEDDRAVERALVDADALDLAVRYPHELSGGERQRVLVAMALAQEPDLLLLDEPTLHLDLAHQVALLASIRRLRVQRGLTVVAVLHDLNLAAAFAPRAVVLHDGRVAADGFPDDVLTPALVERVFGVRMELARTANGGAHLVLSSDR
jgi:ABC-type cobalamin/Fe3+-siderophores transport system ATPase subunit